MITMNLCLFVSLYVYIATVCKDYMHLYYMYILTHYSHQHSPASLRSSVKRPEHKACSRFPLTVSTIKLSSMFFSQLLEFVA